MGEFAYKSFGATNNVSKLVVFLHGYNSSIDDVEPYAKMLTERLENTLVIVPMSDMTSERNPLKQQWYALTDVDPERKRRKPETSTDEIISIYNKTGERISQMAKRVNRFINALQKEYGVNNKNTFVMGFSQGAMLAIYTGLTRRYELGGVFPFAGVISGKDMLEKELASKPSVYLFHGTHDLFVQYKTLGFTKDWLEKHDIFWQSYEYDGIEHKLTSDEIKDAAEIILKQA